MPGAWSISCFYLKNSGTAQVFAANPPRRDLTIPSKMLDFTLLARTGQDTQWPQRDSGKPCFSAKQHNGKLGRSSWV